MSYRAHLPACPEGHAYPTPRRASGCQTCGRVRVAAQHALRGAAARHVGLGPLVYERHHGSAFATAIRIVGPEGTVDALRRAGLDPRAVARVSPTIRAAIGDLLEPVSGPDREAVDMAT